MTDAANDSTTAAPSPRGFSIVRVLMIILPVVLVMAGAVAFFGAFDGARWLTELTYPPLVTGTGQVMYNGEPLDLGEIRTRHVNGKIPGALAFLDAQGRFKIQTEIRGDRIDGAYAGEHKVIVTKYGTAQGAFAPLVVPQKYTSFATTPLTLIISKTPGDNTYSITLEDDPEELAAKQARPGRPGGFGGPPTEVDPAMMSTGDFTNMMFELYDSNKDEFLAADELTSLNEEQRAALKKLDRSGAGIERRSMNMAARGIIPLFPTAKKTSDADTKDSDSQESKDGQTGEADSASEANDEKATVQPDAAAPQGEAAKDE